MTVHNYNEEETLTTTKVSRNNTLLSQLKTELSKPSKAVKEITLKVPSRERLAVRFNSDLSLDQLDRWRLKARKNPKRDDIDLLLFNSTIIISQAEALIFDGEDAVDDDGKAINFRSKETLDMLNALDSAGAVKALYDRDADILRTGTEILKAAGYDDDVEDEDPLV